MKYSDILKQQRMALVDQNKAITDKARTENRAMSPEEMTKWETTDKAIDAFDPQIKAALKQEELEAQASARPGAPTATVEPEPLPKHAVVSYSSPGILKAFRASTFGDRQKAELAAYRSGKWAQAALFGSKKAMQWCQDNGVFAYGTNTVIHNAHEEGTNSAGGYLVPDEFERSIIDLRIQYGALRKWARIVPMTSDYKVQPKRLTGLTAYPVNENAAPTESSKTWGQVALTAKRWGVLTKYSMELGEDAVINIADDLSNEASIAFAYAEDNAGFNGDGTSTYHSITGLVKRFFDGSAASYVGCVTTATHDVFAEIDADDLDKVKAALPEYGGLDLAWYISPVGKALVFDPILRAAGGNTQAEVAAGAPPRYLGYPIRTSSLLPNVATEAYDEDPMLWFGDMSQCIALGDRRGVTFQVLSELYAATGQVGIIASERFDINVHNIGDATTAGPLVAYIGETS